MLSTMRYAAATDTLSQPAGFREGGRDTGRRLGLSEQRTAKPERDQARTSSTDAEYRRQIEKAFSAIRDADKPRS